MNKLMFFGCFFALILTLASCEKTNPNFQAEANNADFFHQSMQQLTDVIVHDIFSPPVASRIYAYPSIAAYEILIHDHPQYMSLSGQLNGLKDVPQPEAGQEYCYPLAAMHAFLKSGRHFIFSEDKMEEFQNEMYDQFKALNMPEAVYKRSMEYGDVVSDHILAWSAGDMYKESRTFPKYTIPEEEALWKPTPPDYMDGIEPHWMKIRPMTLKSAGQFAPPPPTPFSADKDSKFMKEAMEVYEALKENSEERTTIAKFWDCNPYVSHHKGHVMFATKKITPGGHWIGITKTVCQLKDVSLMQAVEAYTMASIALFDGFISCWEEKYRSNLVRPETVINTLIDEDWLPTLQTPPFPEHTSGHSVISAAAAEALTHVLGDNIAFTDSTEMVYGMEPRSFTSFRQAREEAAISRLYGGIHYRPAIDYGVEQGEKVGKYVISNVTTRKGEMGMKEE